MPALPLRPRPRPVALADLAELVGVQAPDRSPSVSGVTLDSREVRPGDLFAALPGERWHGARFTGAAVAAGAVAVLTDRAGQDLAGVLTVPVLVVPDPRALVGAVAARVYGDPADDLLVLGVTGTNGKTTTTWLLEAGLRAAGHRTGLIGTVETRVGDDVWPSTRTTPEAPDLHALLAVMRERGVTAVALEVSSHALALGRVDGLVVDVAGFTQLGRDHLDLHGDQAGYAAAKARLFTPAHARCGVVTVDDEGGRQLAAAATVPVVRLRTGPPPADAPPVEAPPADAPPVEAPPVEAPPVEAPPVEARVTAVVGRPGGGHQFRLRVPETPTRAPGEDRPGLDLHLTVGLPGRFNVANAALAAAMLVVAGVEADAVTAGIGAARPVPGRMEPVDAGQPFAALVDYAHTPDALASVLGAVAAPPGRVLVVFGCGGDRDAAKRPAMGAVAARQADVVVVTDDNPRSEDPGSIRAAVLAGAAAAATGLAPAQRPTLHEEGDRAAAVAWAVAQARPGDVLVVAGKGHEPGQEVAGVVHPFDDRLVLREALLRARHGAEQGADRDTPGGGVLPRAATQEDRP